MKTGKSKIVVMGVGNTLMRDEGIGVHVLEAMALLPLPDHVELVNGWVAGIDLLAVIEKTDRMIIVDAMDAGEPPGALFRFNPEEVRVMLDECKTSLHQVDLFETLKIARFLGRCPETVIIGVQPKEVAWGLEPTPELAALVPRIIDLVISEIQAGEA